MGFQLELLSRNEVLGSILRVVEKHAEAFRDIFRQYSKGGPDKRHPEGERRISEEQFLRLAKDFRLCHGVLTRVQLQRIFRACATLYCPPLPPRPPSFPTTAAFPSSPPRSPSPRQVRYLGLSYGDFLLALGQAAVMLFSGPDWDRQHPELAQKFQLLLFWMDQSSERFVGNGHDLLQHVLHHPVSFRHQPADNKTIQPLSMLPRYPPLDVELREVFHHYCTLANPLNVGVHALLGRQQFRQLLSDAGLLGGGVSSADVDVIFTRALLVAHPVACLVPAKRLSYDQFYAALGQVATRRFPSHSSGEEKDGSGAGPALYCLVTHYLLPSASRMAAAQCLHCERRAAAGTGRGSASVRGGRWRQRWHDVENLRQDMRSSAEVAGIFGLDRLTPPATTTTTTCSSTSPLPPPLQHQEEQGRALEQANARQPRIRQLTSVGPDGRVLLVTRCPPRAPCHPGLDELASPGPPYAHGRQDEEEEAAACQAGPVIRRGGAVRAEEGEEEQCCGPVEEGLSPPVTGHQEEAWMEQQQAPAGGPCGAMTGHPQPPLLTMASPGHVPTRRPRPRASMPSQSVPGPREAHRLDGFWRAQYLEAQREVASRHQPAGGGGQAGPSPQLLPWEAFLQHHCEAGTGAAPPYTIEEEPSELWPPGAPVPQRRMVLPRHQPPQSDEEYMQPPPCRAPPRRSSAGQAAGSGGEEEGAAMYEDAVDVQLLEEATSSLQTVAATVRERAGQEEGEGAEDGSVPVSSLSEAVLEDDDEDGEDDGKEEDGEARGGVDGAYNEVSMLPDGFETTVPVLVLPPEPAWVKDDEQGGEPRASLPLDEEEVEDDTATIPIRIKLLVVSSQEEEEEAGAEEGPSSRQLYFQCLLSRRAGQRPACAATIDAVTWKFLQDRFHASLGHVSFPDGPAFLLKALQETQAAWALGACPMPEDEGGEDETVLMLEGQQQPQLQPKGRMSCLLVQQPESIVELRLVRVGLEGEAPEEVLAIDLFPCDETSQAQDDAAVVVRSGGSSQPMAAW